MAATRFLTLASKRLSLLGVKFLTKQGVLLLLLGLALFASFRYETFLTPLNLMNIMRQNSMLALVALGMTVVILSGGIDLSVGALVALGGVTSTLR